MKQTLLIIFSVLLTIKVYSTENNKYHNQALTVLNKEGLAQADKALKLLDMSIKNRDLFVKSSLFASGLCLLCFEQLPKKDSKWLKKGLKYVDVLLNEEPENVDALVKKAQILMDRQSYNQGSICDNIAKHVACN